MKMLILLVAIFIAAIDGICADVPARGLILYCDVPSTYVELREFVRFQAGSMYSTIVLPTGETRRLTSSGIIAVLDYPNASESSVAESAPEQIQKAKNLEVKYPQYKQQLERAWNKWSNASNVAKQQEKKSVTPPPINNGLSLTVGNDTYKDVKLSSVDDDTATIVHSTGAARIPLSALTGRQISLLNETTTTIKIASDWRAKATSQKAPVSSDPLATSSDIPASPPQTQNDAPLPKDQTPAYISQSLSSFVERYGPPNDVTGHFLTKEQLEINPLFSKLPSDAKVLRFRKAPYTVTALFAKGTAEWIMYQHVEQNATRALTDFEIETILKKNSASLEWHDDSGGLLHDPSWSWYRSDEEAYASYSDSDLALLVFSKARVDAIAEVRGVVIRSLKESQEKAKSEAAEAEKERQKKMQEAEEKGRRKEQKEMEGL